MYAVGFLALVLVFFQIVVIRFAVTRTEHKVNHIMAFMQLDPAGPLPLSDRVKELARDPARRGAAVEAHMAATGVGLSEAMTAIDAYRATLPG